MHLLGISAPQNDLSPYDLLTDQEYGNVSLFRRSRHRLEELSLRQYLDGLSIWQHMHRQNLLFLPDPRCSQTAFLFHPENRR